MWSFVTKAETKLFIGLLTIKVGKLGIVCLGQCNAQPDLLGTLIKQ